MPRVLYLSLSNERYSPNYFPFLRRYIGSVAAAGTEVELRGTRVGKIDSFRLWEILDSNSILDSVLEAEHAGFDAVAIGNILDPALREARSMVDTSSTRAFPTRRPGSAPCSPSVRPLRSPFREVPKSLSPQADAWPRS